MSDRIFSDVARYCRASARWLTAMGFSRTKRLISASNPWTLWILKIKVLWYFGKYKMSRIIRGFRCQSMEFCILNYTHNIALTCLSYLVGKNTANAGDMLHARFVLPLHALGLLKPPESHLTRASSWGVVTSPPCPAGRGGCSQTFKVCISTAWNMNHLI